MNKTVSQRAKIKKMVRLPFEGAVRWPQVNLSLLAGHIWPHNRPNTNPPIPGLPWNAVQTSARARLQNRTTRIDFSILKVNCMRWLGKHWFNPVRVVLVLIPPQELNGPLLWPMVYSLVEIIDRSHGNPVAAIAGEVKGLLI